ncbi:MAG: DMT family transporter [Candidatus Aenigmarchaeota archaeon]|nr:DMT family transporter [Candidatus Aenigmarchaeota archaeon]
MTWELYALVAALGFGVQALLLRRIMLKADAVTFFWAFNALLAAFTLPLLVIDASLPSGIVPWLILLAGVVLWIFEGLLVFESYKHTEISLLKPLSTISVLLVFVLSVVFLNEAATVQKILGTLAVFVGIAVLTWEKRLFAKFSAKGVRLVIASTFLTALVVIVDKVAMSYFHPIPYTFLVTLAPAVLLAPFMRARQHHVRVLFKQKHAMLAVTCLGIVAYLATLTAYTLTDASNVMPVIQLSVIVAVAGGFILHKEKDIALRLLGALFMIAGAALILKPGII